MKKSQGTLLWSWPFPLRRLEITSSLSPAEFERRLAAVTRQRRSWRIWPSAPIRFVGRVSSGVFRILTVVRGLNTYGAWVLGRIQPFETGSRISARLTVHQSRLWRCSDSSCYRSCGLSKRAQGST